MIIEHKTIDLFGKMLFEKVILTPPYRKTNPMPDEACFLYIVEGTYRSISEVEQMDIKARESVLMKCGNYLSQMSSAEKGKPYQAVAVHFYPDILKKVYNHELPGFLKRVNTTAGGMGKINSDVLVSKYMESILYYFDNPALVEEEILILKLKEIVLLLNQTQNAPAIQNILANLFNPSSYGLREIIHAHQYSAVTIGELAQLTSMSLSTFKREFHRIYKTSPATYLKERKLSRAVELLSIPQQRMSAIAYECGFSDIAHFSKSFKRKFGVSPSSFRLTQTDKSLS